MPVFSVVEMIGRTMFEEYECAGLRAQSTHNQKLGSGGNVKREHARSINKQVGDKSVAVRDRLE